jgi:hypothetical protein
LLDWVTLVEVRYHVNPWVFLAIYLVTLPPGWYGTYRAVVAVRERNRTSLRAWAAAVAAMVLAPYLYVLVAGRNLPWWFYPVLVCLVALSAWEVASRVRKLSREAAGKPRCPQDEALE